MPRARTSVAVICIAAIAFAAFLPGLSVLDCAICEPGWVLLPDLSASFAPDLVKPSDDQTVSLLSLLPTRAPPA